LISADYDAIGLDNLCNSRFEVVAQIAKITHKSSHFIEGDAQDSILLKSITKDLMSML